MKIQILSLLLLLYQLGVCQSVTIDPNLYNSSLIEAKSNSKSVLTPRLSSSQRSAIANPTSGLLVYDTTTNSFWYFNGTSWKEIYILSLNNQWIINGDNQQSPVTSSVGINIFAAKSKFQIAAKYRTQAIFGTNYSGISFVANNPAIGFNIYNDSTNTNRNLSLGYGFLQEFETSTGKFSLKSLNYRPKDSVTAQSNPGYIITNTGQFGSRFETDLSAQTKFFNTDFSKLGENAPAIKCRLYTGTTIHEKRYNPDTGQYDYNRYTIIHLDMLSFKPLKISIVIECGGNLQYIQPNQCGDSFYGRHCYRYFIDNSGFLTIVHEGSASLDTYSKPYKAFVTYIN